MRVPRDLRPVVKLAEDAGWTVQETAGGHITLLSPDKSTPPVVLPTSPSDHRARKNLLSLLRRYGLEVPRDM